MTQTGLQLPSLSDPAMMEQATKRYRELTQRPEDAPLSSPGGSDISYIQQEELRHYEANLLLLVESGQMDEAEASVLLNNKRMELAMQGGL
jgi:hypothetical protein